MAMFSTNHYELAISKCKKLEKMLADGLGATGKGLHEKVSSVQDRLPSPLVKRLRYIASVRNNLVHESDSNRIDDVSGYKEACSKAEKELKELIRSKKAGCLTAILAIVGVTFFFWCLSTA